MNTKGLISGLIITGCVTMALRCTDPADIAGNSSQTPNAAVAGMLYHPDGKTPAAGILVKIRPRSTLADTSGLDAGLPKDTASSLTDSYGRFAFDSTLSSGTYVIEATDDNNAVLIDSVIVNQSSTDSIPPDTLKPAGAIRGIIKLSEGGDPRKVFVLAFGIDRFARVEEDGRFKFSSLAEANYDLRFISGLNNYGVFDTVKISVISEDTTDLDTINLPFTGIPTPKALSVNYDTLTNRVMLFWSTENPHLVSGYKVYRREESSVQYTIACDTILNSTFFTDGIINGLEKGKTYQYIIRAVDSLENEGTNSEYVSVRIAFFVDAGKDTTCQLGDSVLLEARIDSSTIIPTEYRFDADGDGTSDFVSATVPTFKYTYADTGTFKAVFAIRSNTTIYSDTVIIRITSKDTTSAPSAPQNVKLSYDTLSQKVTIQWSTPWESDFKGCNIYRKDDGANQYTIVNNSLVTDTIFTDSLSNGLVKGLSYQYYLTAFDNSSNESQNSVSVSVRIAFFVDAGKDTSYQLGDSATLKARIDSITITPTEYRFDANGDGTNDLVSATATTFKWAYVDTGTYKAVITIQASSRTFSDTVRITIVPKDTAGAPVAPQGLSLSYDTLKQIVTLTWIRNLENDIKGYNVYRKHSDSALVKINTALIAGTTFSDSTAIQDQTYEYKIAAVDNADNEGEKSAGVSVNVKPPFTFVASLSQTTLLTPQDMVFNDSIILVVEYDSSFLFTLDTTNKIISTDKLKDSSQTPIIYPTGIALDNQAIYIAAENGLFKYDGNGVYQQKFQNTASRPNRVAVLDSFVYVTTDLNIVKYRKDGTIVAQFSSYGTGTDQVKNPKGIVAMGDSIFVCDRDNNRIQIFSTNGIYQGKWGTYGLANGQFDRPTAIAKDQTNNLYVVDQGNNRVQVFSRAGGVCITKFAIDNASANTRGIAINSSGDVILAVGNALKLYGRN